MEYNVYELKEKIDDYFSGKMLKEQLGSWAEHAYYDLIKGGYIEKKKIVIYPFLKIISQFHIEINDKEDIYPCSEEDVKNIQNILLGKINYDFEVEMSTPLLIYNMCINKKYFNKDKREFFLKIREKVFDMNTGIEYSNLHEQASEIFNMQISNNTVLDMLEENIIRIFRVMFDANAPELIHKKYMFLYARKQDRNLIGKKLLNYIDCYIGDKNFNVLVNYVDGKPQLTLLV